jgi:hypothetical protein
VAINSKASVRENIALNHAGQASISQTGELQTASLVVMSLSKMDGKGIAQRVAGQHITQLKQGLRLVRDAEVSSIYTAANFLGNRHFVNLAVKFTEIK